MKEIYHFIGLGGIGMSALARILLQRGHTVQGSDSTPSPLLTELEKEGAVVHLGHHGEAVSSATTVVYSSGIHEQNVEVIRAKELALPLLHRSDLLHWLMNGKQSLLVTGTHGKTTTTALLASVLSEAQVDPSWVLGGIHQKWKTNGKLGSGSFFVAEADESDGSFLKTPAYGAIVTNLENDHLDHWKTAKELDAGFARFFAQAQHPEHLFWCGDDPRLKALSPPGVSYGFDPSNALRISFFAPTKTGLLFDLEWKGKRYTDIELHLWGRHNALNGAAVFGLALSLGIPESLIRKAFSEFAGTERRLEKKGEAHAAELYDDYGHHPTEIAVTLRALRDKIREKRLIVVFQPHRYTRVRDLFDSFLTCFGEADLLAMTDIYAAGEAPIEGITTATLYAKMREKLGAKVYFFPRNYLETGVAELLRPHDVVLTIGAGDVTKAGEPILDLYRQKAPKWTLGVLFGGTSAEHPVTLMSAKTILHALDPSLYEIKLFGVTKEGEWITGTDALEKLEQKVSFAPGTPKLPPAVLQELTHCDALIPVFHGPQGEDGMVQGLFDLLHIPYVGCDYRAGVLCMHKGWTKQIALMNGVPTAPFVEIDSVAHRRFPDLLRQRIAETLTYPVWIKPVHLGSSIGITRVTKEEDLSAAIDHAFHYDDILIAEQEVVGSQIEFGLFGNEHICIAEPCKVLNEEAFLSYEKKYGPTACGFEIPAQISPMQKAIGQELAITMYKSTGCKGLARIDFFLDQNGHFWLNEINPFPGFTPTSAYPQMWEASGMPITSLCDQLVILAFHKHRRMDEVRGR
ncbi:MAG: UDP-N-acetylmuramate--L-alanine ligase [Verrucomicrobiota bacterium]|nr:UDP-N-acetylmuramate--L-alanine ligase [Verrucomicrobiota bacterium]